ncbi:hypothetical protein PPYR_15445, partial [Photinus pyralis]
MELNFNIDGLPLHKSTKQQFWPILCVVSNLADQSPFIVALYFGHKKPPLEEYLCDFINELKIYLKDGLVLNNTIIKITVRSFCCDMPARCFVKNVMNHNSYSGCDKCSVRGDIKNKRMIFCNLTADLRTTESFEILTDSYHKGSSPLSKLPVDMMTAFPIDYMHSVCLGVMRKLLFLWRDKGKPYGIKNIIDVNTLILELRPYWPAEFNRKPRSLSELEHWKATEYRQFLLYVGPIVLKKKLPHTILCNFLLLKFGISILLNENLNKSYNQYADKLLRLFVKHAIAIYSKEFCVYNVHSLIHLSKDAKIFNTLNTINCFAFETFLGSLKNLLRKPNLPLEQIVRPYEEL